MYHKLPHNLLQTLICKVGVWMYGRVSCGKAYATMSSDYRVKAQLQMCCFALFLQLSYAFLWWNEELLLFMFSVLHLFTIQHSQVQANLIMILKECKNVLAFNLKTCNQVILFYFTNRIIFGVGSWIGKRNAVRKCSACMWTSIVFNKHPKIFILQSWLTTILLLQDAENDNNNTEWVDVSKPLTVHVCVGTFTGANE